MNILTTMFVPLTRIRASFDWLAGPQSMLCSVILSIARAYLSYAFFRSGLTRLNDWDTTVLLFTREYRVSLLPSALVAALGTFGEPVFPLLMLASIVPRLAVVGLLFVSVMAAVPYWANLSTSVIEFHFVRGVLIALVATVGSGWLAAQTLWQRRRR